MKVTIDSTEPLADALRVIGALYNVTLVEAGETQALGTGAGGTGPAKAATAATNGSRRRTAARAPAGGTGATKRPRSPRKAQEPSSAEIREWALAHGHSVSSRGTLPAAVKTAYASAHKH